MKTFKFVYTVIFVVLLSQVVLAKGEPFKISDVTIEYLKGDLENLLSESAYEILQDSLLGTVSDLKAGDNFNVSDNEWSTTLEALKKIDYGIFEIEDNTLKVRQAIESSQLTAISSRHSIDKNENERFLIRFSELLQDWIQTDEE